MWSDALYILSIKFLIKCFSFSLLSAQTLSGGFGVDGASRHAGFCFWHVALDFQSPVKTEEFLRRVRLFLPGFLFPLPVYSVVPHRGHRVRLVLAAWDLTTSLAWYHGGPLGVPTEPRPSSPSWAPLLPAWGAGSGWARPRVCVGSIGVWKGGGAVGAGASRHEALLQDGGVCVPSGLLGLGDLEAGVVTVLLEVTAVRRPWSGHSGLGIGVEVGWGAVDVVHVALHGPVDRVCH